MNAADYFGDETLVPGGLKLRAGPLRVQYESGALRYVRLGETEVVRMMYAALRDEHWGTVPAQIRHEQLETGPDWFRISYDAHYAEGPIRYTARMTLAGDDAGTLTISMAGEAQSDFLRNRIGLCVLHPLTDAGRALTVTRPDGGTYEGRFPESIAPHQPFRDIQKMTWTLDSGPSVGLSFEGEVFETEDQRNWTDASFKTYGTPLDLPFPAAVRRGEKIAQTVRLQLTGAVPDGEETPGLIRFERVEPPVEVPEWGLVLNAETAVSPRPAFGYAELRVRGLTWRAELRELARRAERLSTPLALTVWFGRNYPNEIDQLREELVPLRGLIRQVLLRSDGYPVTPPELLREVVLRWKQVLPDVLIGYGTTDNFAELNRNRPPDDLDGWGDFLHFPVDPQVHRTDSQTILENAAALRDVLRTAQGFAAGRAVHVGPVGLAARNRPAFDDPRRDSLFGLTWTALCLGYLAGARAVTLVDSAPARFLIRLFEKFQPVRLRMGTSSQPLSVDGWVLQTATGDELGLLGNPTAQTRTVRLDAWAGTAGVYRISAADWATHRDAAALDWLKPVPESLAEGLRLPAFSVALVWLGAGRE